MRTTRLSGPAPTRSLYSRRVLHITQHDRRPLAPLPMEFVTTRADAVVWPALHSELYGTALVPTEEASNQVVGGVIAMLGRRRWRSGCGCGPLELEDWPWLREEGGVGREEETYGRQGDRRGGGP